MGSGKPMRVLLSIFSVNEQILHIRKNLEVLGCEVEVIYSDAYRQVCPYYRKKIDELGFHSAKRGYLKSVHEKIDELLQNFCPDLVLFINAPKDILSAEDVQRIGQCTKTACWFVDGIAGQQDIVEYIKAFHEIHVFEHSDVAYLNTMGIHGTYLPVGYNDAFSHVRTQEKEWDALFIGSPFHNRLQILEKVAAAATENQWNLKIMGPFYDETYPWKKFLFKRKYPGIYRYLENRRVSSEEAAELYAKTKVCLNIHDTKHKSPNPRTFEILASGSFELIDQREYWSGLTPDKDIVAYDNVQELVQKLEGYIKDDAARERIAASGKSAIIEKMKMKNLLREILTDA